MNLKDEEIRALRVAIERITWMMQQPQYENVKTILCAKKNDYLNELEVRLEC